MEYHGVVIHRNPGRKLLTLAANFMDASCEPLCLGSSLTRAILVGWWQQVAKSI